MLEIRYTKQFLKELKLAGKRGKNVRKLELAMEMLASEKVLDRRYREHALVGQYRSRKECHIEPDWLLIYKIETGYIIFERTGTHADLFR